MPRTHHDHKTARRTHMTGRPCSGDVIPNDVVQTRRADTYVTRTSPCIFLPTLRRTEIRHQAATASMNSGLRRRAPFSTSPSLRRFDRMTAMVEASGEYPDRSQSSSWVRAFG